MSDKQDTKVNELFDALISGLNKSVGIDGDEQVKACTHDLLQQLRNDFLANYEYDPSEVVGLALSELQDALKEDEDIDTDDDDDDEEVDDDDDEEVDSEDDEQEDEDDDDGDIPAIPPEPVLTP